MISCDRYGYKHVNNQSIYSNKYICMTCKLINFCDKIGSISGNSDVVV